MQKLKSYFLFVVDVVGPTLIILTLLGVLIVSHNKKTEKFLHDALNKNCIFERLTERASALPGGVYSVYKCADGSEIRAYGDFSRLAKK